MVESSTVEAIEQAVSDCHTAFREGTTRPMEWRLAQLKALERMLVEQEARFCAAMAEDLGKSTTDSWLLEISYVITASKFVRRNLPQWSREKKVSTPWVVLPANSLIKPEPLGTVLIISTWNYPLQLSLAPLLTAIAAGNCVVLKPSEQAPATSAALAQIMPEYLDAKCIHVLQGGADVSTEILRQNWDHIVYTGGDRVAKIVMAAAAKTLTPVTLELGGKSPCIVLPDANLEITAKRIVWGRFTNAGQTCIAPDHILADRATCQKLILLMQAEITAMFSSEPKHSADYGRIVNTAHFDRVNQMIEPDKVVIGGQTDRSARYIAPTVLYPVSRQSPSMAAEIFGPVLPVLEVESFEQAVDWISEGPKPLAAYLFTKCENSIQSMLDKVSAGNICINDVMMFMAVDSLPFGGVGASGIGSYKGEAGFRRLSHEKSVLRRSWWPDFKLRYAPFNEKKKKWLRRIR